MSEKPGSAALATIREALMIGADDQKIARACSVLNGIVITVDQYERGMHVRRQAIVNRGDGDEALEKFCQRESLLPSDAAALAFLIRSNPIDEARYHGEELKKHNRALYEDCITRTIHRGYFRLLDPSEVDAEGNVIPLPELAD